MTTKAQIYELKLFFKIKINKVNKINRKTFTIYKNNDLIF